MKKVNILFIALLMSISLVKAQDNNKTVTLTVSSSGKTQDEARVNAMRSAIEQAFGAFISTSTQIVNDTIIRDEIVSITSGNIQKYDIISEIELPQNGYLSTLKVIVSINKLNSFCKSKGINVEFDGGGFAANIALQELNEKNENITWNNTHLVLSKIIEKCFDYKIDASSPKLINRNKLLEDITNNGKWEVPLIIKVRLNDNFKILSKVIFDFLSSSSLPKSELENYISTGKSVYSLIYAADESHSGQFFFRTENVRDDIFKIPFELFVSAINGFSIDNGLDNFTFKQYVNKNSLEIKDMCGCIFLNCKTGLTKNCIFGNYNNNIPHIFNNSSNQRNKYFNESDFLNAYNTYKSNSSFLGKTPIGMMDKSTISNEFKLSAKRYFDPIHESKDNFDNTFKAFKFMEKLETFKSDVYKNNIGCTSLIPFKLNNYAFLEISLSDIRTIEEIKKIKEYKIIK